MTVDQKKAGRPPLPVEERRVRLAGGPTVEPATLATVRRLAGVHNLSLGEVIDFMVYQYNTSTRMSVAGWLEHKEKETEREVVCEL